MALKCSSAHDVNYHIHALNTHLCLAETEDTWDRISSAIVQLTTLCKNGACDYPDALIAGLRPLSNPITSAMKSERTRLSGIAVDFVSELVAGLGRAFEPFLNTFFPVLLSLCARPNKVVISRTRACILSIIETTQLPAILPLFVQSIKDKSASLRIVAAEGALACLNCFNPPDLEKESRAKDIETLVKATSRDANADVRKLGKKIFEAYKLLLPHRVDSFTAPLTPTIKKYLNVTNNNRPAAAAIPLQKKVLAASTSAVKSMAPSLASSTTSNPARVLTKSASSALPTTRPPTRDPAARPPKPISSSNSTKAMPPPSLPVRPTLPAKSVTASLSNLRNVDRGTTAPSRPPMRIERPDPKPTSTTSSAPQRPPIRAPKPPSPTGISFPTGTDADDKVDNTKSHPNLVRAVPEHTRTRSLFGQKPEPPQLGKRPEPKPKVVPAKPVIAKTRPEKVSSSSATTTKHTSRPRPAAAGSFIPSKSAPEIAGKKSESAATKAVATRRVEKAPSKPLWGSGAKKPEPKKVARPRPESRVESSRSRPVSRVESTRPVSRVESTRPVSRVESIRPASRVESVRSRPTSRVESVRSKPESRVPTPASSSAVEDPTADSPAESDERPASSPVESVPEVQASEEVESSEPVVVTESVEVETLGEAPEDVGEQDKEVAVSAEQANNIQIMIAAASPRPMTPSADAERKAWEMKLLEKTPITSLLASIEQGFMFTPSSPLSPPASYLNRGINDTTNFGAPVPVLDLESKKMATKDSATFLFGGGENALSK